MDAGRRGFDNSRDRRTGQISEQMNGMDAMTYTYDRTITDSDFDEESRGNAAVQCDLAQGRGRR